PPPSCALFPYTTLFRSLQCFADRFGLIALEAGEAGAEQLSVILGNDRLGEGIGLAQQAAGLAAGKFDPLLGFAFAFQRADLDDRSEEHTSELQSRGHLV